MESVKTRDQFLEPDQRCASFKVRDRATDAFRPMTPDDLYADLAGLDLNPGVPEAVLSYLNVMKNLYLYGWLCYPLFATCQCVGGMAIEMALRTRLPVSGKRDARGLKKLLRIAIDKGLLRDGGFPTLPDRQAESRRTDERWEKATGSKAVYQAMPYVELLAIVVPEIRNGFAHPRQTWILTPDMALGSIVRVVEIVNQLWPRADN